MAAKTRSLKYEMMMGVANRVSPDAARTSAPVSVAVTMIVPRAAF
jgi:hypothetical protein